MGGNMYTIAALYHFTRFENPADIKPALLDLCVAQEVKGSLLLAKEGINGTIAGPRAGIDAVLSHIKALPGCADLEWKEATSDHPPFGKMKVRLKKEIVTMGQPDVDPRARVGNYVEPADWNDLIRQDDVVVIDTRNDYEVAIGTFEGALNPNTETFREFPDYVKKNLDPKKHKKVAMFCTGGIRCEKSTAYAKEQGFEEVYHLEGGILKYLEEVDQPDSLWQGECFVFDNRVSVKQGLEPGEYALCHGCRWPITDADRQSEKYEEGVSCPACHDTLTDEQRQRFRDRQKQIELARQRNVPHVGAPPPERQRSRTKDGQS